MINTIKKFISKNTGMLIRLDDIADNMNWHLMDKCETLFDSLNVKPLLGVIPNNCDQELKAYEKKNDFWNRVRNWQTKGWEISMHGFSHVYDTETKKKDYFGYGGKSEFFGHDYETQLKKINQGLKKFREERIKVRSFFAPNHTYDQNTLRALKASGIKNIIDGYGLVPYSENDLNFIPQLFYKEIMLPFGIQSTQIHLNYWKEEQFLVFKNFVIENSTKVISFDEALKRLKNNYFSKIINFSTKGALKGIRYLR